MTQPDYSHYFRQKGFYHDIASFWLRPIDDDQSLSQGSRFLPGVAELSRSSVLRVATLTRRRVSIGHYPVGGSYQCSPSISGRTFRRRMSNGGFGFSIESKQISTRRSGVPGIFRPRKRSETFCLGKITPPGPSRGPSRARGPLAPSRINILIIITKL